MPVLIGVDYTNGQVFSKQLESNSFDWRVTQLPRPNLPRVQESSGGSPDKSAISEYFPQGFQISDTWIDEIDRIGIQKFLVVNFNH